MIILNKKIYGIALWLEWAMEFERYLTVKLNWGVTSPNDLKWSMGMQYVAKQFY
jgi:hypothetical protein